MKNKLIYVKSAMDVSIDLESQKIKISGYASTNDVDRAGDVITPEAWKDGLDNYQKNPIMLFNHDYNRPVGRATSVSLTDKGLFLEGEVSVKAAPDIAALVEDNILKAFSVGFMVKDAIYDSATDIFKITEAELHEVSIVSVPCNQDAVFSVAKSFDSDTEYKLFVKSIVKADDVVDSVNTQDATNIKAKKSEENDMTPEEMQKLLKQVAEETAKSITDTQAKAKADADAKVQAQAEADAKFTIQVKTAAESLLEDVENRFSEKNESLETIVTELKDELASKSEEIAAIRESKRHFSDRNSGTDWKKAFEQDMADAHILGLATGKGWNTKTSATLIEKVNSFSGVEVSSADFEQVVSSNIERDIENELVLAPLFRELPMTAATMILPILPDAGYAEFVSTATTTATAPKGNLDMRSASYGDNAGVSLNERTVTTKKLMSVSYLGNETEEDAIIPILPLIRESMVRSHARAVENAILVGNHADGAFATSGASFDGLVALAAADGNVTQPGGSYSVGDAVTAADLFNLRKNMGKYGLRPEDVIYIVSQDVYYNLIEDSESQDVSLVGAIATKVKGSIGSAYGSEIIVCDEFAAKGAGTFNAVAVNTRNFLIPRLRGMTVETDYETANQRRVLVSTQRLGFIDLIDGATAKWALQYKAA